MIERVKTIILGVVALVFILLPFISDSLGGAIFANATLLGVPKAAWTAIFLLIVLFFAFMMIKGYKGK